MTTQRTIQETPEMRHLEKQVAETAAVVDDWKNSIASLDDQINAVNLALAKAKQQGEIHRAKASTGDPAAMAALKAARDAQAAAESTLVNLRVARSAAAASLAEAERVAANARRQIARVKVEILQWQRVDVAREIMKVLADLSCLLSRYVELGHQIVDLPDAAVLSGGLTSDFENAMGAKRLRDAMPALIQTLYPGAPRVEQQKADFAAAERRQWNLPEQPDEKAA